MRVCTGNNGAMHFNAFMESFNHAHSVAVYLSVNLDTCAVSTSAIAHDIYTTFLKTEIIK